MSEVQEIPSAPSSSEIRKCLKQGNVCHEKLETDNITNGIFKAKIYQLSCLEQMPEPSVGSFGIGNIACHSSDKTWIGDIKAYTKLCNVYLTDIADCRVVKSLPTGGNIFITRILRSTRPFSCTRGQVVQTSSHLLSGEVTKIFLVLSPFPGACCK